MAISPDGKTLYPMLEKPVEGETGRRVLIHSFDLQSRQYSDVRYTYALEPKGTSACDFVLTSPRRGLVIERDGTSGDLNGHKMVYQITLPESEGPVAKQPVADLLHLADPHHISDPVTPGDVGLGETFAMPFVTIESIVVIDPQTIGVLNDNNFPMSVGRHMGSKQPDDNEFVLIRLDRPLGE